jgi:hypothetical protein
MDGIKINTLETHDRLLDFKKKNQDTISQQIHKMVMQRPFDDHPFYIFAHKKTVDMHDQLIYIQEGCPPDKIPTHRIIWQPRLRKPKAETNTMLFKVDPSYPDQVKIIWILPDESQWEAYKKGQMCQDPTTVESIYAYENDRASLEAPEEDDPTDERARTIYQRLYPKLWERLFANAV